MTPPSTPTRTSHGKSDSTSSLQESHDVLRRGNSVRSPHKGGVDAKEMPGSTAPRNFPHLLTDYEVEVDSRGKKKPLGSGAWSTVYRAAPRLPKLDCLSTPNAGPGPEMTPPVTPVHSRNSSLSKTQIPRIPTAYAVKEPTGRTAQRVLCGESRALSYLSRFPGADDFVVPFYGQDSRTHALVLGLMDGTLEDWTQKTLDCLSEDDRTAKLAVTFPTLASHLLSGFIWITEKHCIHGDLKPANILVSSTPPAATPHAVYTDFSSAILSLADSVQQSPIGGATFDYLDPNLMTKAAASSLPTPVTDLWSLAMTLLVVVLGVSPYSRLAANAYMKNEYIKQGSPLAFLKQGENALRNVTRLQGLSARLGWDVEAWLGAVLVKDARKRAEVVEWLQMLQRGTLMRAGV